MRRERAGRRYTVKSQMGCTVECTCMVTDLGNHVRGHCYTILNMHMSLHGLPLKTP